MQSNNTSLIPSLIWHQNRESIFFVIELPETSEHNINISNEKLYFFALSNSKSYEMNFDFFENIDSEKSSYTIENKHIKFSLKKGESNNWLFLTKDKNVYRNNIKINWNAWVDEDEEEEPDLSQQMDFQRMMASMGGGGMDMASMGGGMDMASMMGGMGDGEEDEVDDALGGQDDTLDGQDDTLDGQDEGSLHNDDCQDKECEECSA
jgi:hypothetical protein